MKDTEILDQIQDLLDYHYIVWIDDNGHYQLACTRQELYRGVSEMRRMIHARRNQEKQMKIKNAFNQESEIDWKEELIILVASIGSATYGKERWFLQDDGKWYDRDDGKYISQDELFNRIRYEIISSQDRD